MKNRIKNTLLSLTIGGTMISAIFGINHLEKIRRDEALYKVKNEIRITYDIIDKSLNVMRGTNSEITLESGQRFLDNQNINYILKTNDILGMGLSRAQNWQVVYITIKNKDFPVGGIVPGSTTRSNLQTYLESKRY